MGGGRYSVIFSKAFSATIGVGLLLAPSTKRVAIYDLILGCSSQPTDDDALWRLERQRLDDAQASAGTARTPQALSGSDEAAASSTALDALTTDSGNSSGFVLLAVAMNSRSVYRWMATEQGVLYLASAAAASSPSSAVLRTPTSSAPRVGTATAFFWEE